MCFVPAGTATCTSYSVILLTRSWLEHSVFSIKKLQEKKGKEAEGTIESKVKGEGSTCQLAKFSSSNKQMTEHFNDSLLN